MRSLNKDSSLFLTCVSVSAGHFSPWRRRRTSTEGTGVPGGCCGHHITQGTLVRSLNHAVHPHPFKAPTSFHHVSKLLRSEMTRARRVDTSAARAAAAAAAAARTAASAAVGARGGGGGGRRTIFRLTAHRNHEAGGQSLPLCLYCCSTPPPSLPCSPARTSADLLLPSAHVPLAHVLLLLPSSSA